MQGETLREATASSQELYSVLLAVTEKTARKKGNQISKSLEI